MVWASRAIGVVSILFCLSTWAISAEPQVLPLWPEGKLAQAQGQEKVSDLTPGKVDRFVTNVWVPTLTVYLPPEDKATGAAVVICPGGAYVGVAMDREGHNVARWLNSIGVAGVVLKYRMPHPELSAGEKPWPLQDAQRAIRTVRERAKDWKLDPKRVGIMGFSAGGHLASTAGTHFEEGKADASDPVERWSCRPDFMILVYPVVTFKSPLAHEGSRVNLLGKEADEKLVAEYSNELQVTPRTPATFLIHAKDDGVKVENSLQFRDALVKAGVPCRLELYEKGGHGYGLGMNGGEVATWPSRCAEWLKGQKLLDR
ncbi:MAG TPA: alpha/beta hydrolase [Tepidisphaeraceae bacterium]|nr:alpha/beta hydrolase [Tepidisphaeraceae bacterium]